jgi:hypothetical protein
MTIMMVGPVVFQYTVSGSNFNPDNVFAVICLFLYCDDIVIICLIYGIKVYAVIRGKSSEEHKKIQEQKHLGIRNMFTTVAAPAGYFSNNSPGWRHTCGTLELGTNNKPVHAIEKISEVEAVITHLGPQLHAEQKNSGKLEGSYGSEVAQETTPTNEEPVGKNEDTTSMAKEEEKVELISKHHDGFLKQKMTLIQKFRERPYSSHPEIGNCGNNSSPSKSKRRGSFESLSRIWQRLKMSFDSGRRLSFDLQRASKASTKSHSGRRSKSAGNVYSVSFKPLSLYESGTVSQGQNTLNDICQLSRNIPNDHGPWSLCHFRDSGVGSALVLTEHQDFLLNLKEQDRLSKTGSGSLISTAEVIVHHAAKWKKHGNNNQPAIANYKSVPKAGVSRASSSKEAATYSKNINTSSTSL